jgi:hypothetical protein
MERKSPQEQNVYERLITIQDAIVNTCISRWRGCNFDENAELYYKLYLIPQWRKHDVLMESFDITCFVGTSTEYDIIDTCRKGLQLIKVMFKAKLFAHSLENKLDDLTEEQRLISVERLQDFGDEMKQLLEYVHSHVARFFTETQISVLLTELTNKLQIAGSQVVPN